MPPKTDIDARLDAAIASHEARDLDRAEQSYRDVLRIQPDHAEALNLLGLVLQDRGMVGESIALISRALEVDPDFPDALANLARGYSFQGKPEKAASAARKATELDPTLGEAWLQLGRASLDLLNDQEALDALREASSHFPDLLEIYAGMGFAAQRLGQLKDAAEVWRIVLDVQPDRIDALVNLGTVYCQIDQIDAALEVHRKAVALAPDDLTALAALAGTLHRLYDAQAFVPMCEEVLSRGPQRADILTILAAGQMWLGRIDEAINSCEAALKVDPDYIPSRQLLGRLKPDTLDAATVARFREQLNDPAVPVEERAPAGFAIGSALDKAGEFDAAFDMYRMANSLYRERGRAVGKVYDPDEFRAYVEWARSQFTSVQVPQMGSPSELPVFIVGMPRSGTSLVEQIAASHPRVFGAGELNDIAGILKRINRIPAYVPVNQWEKDQVRNEAEQHVARLTALGGGANRVIDKMPDNVKILGQIRILFPRAKIIICDRDLRDVCVSCFTTPFGEGITWAWDIEDCARHAVETRRLMDHWLAVLPGPILEVNYEALVANMEVESRRLIEFLGLEWDPACLAFHNTERQVTTASALQVRRPIYSSSVGKWRRYETRLGPMLRILGKYVREPTVAGSPETPEAEAVRQAAASRIRGDLPRAIEILRNAATRFPFAHEVHTSLGQMLGENDDLEDAVGAWRYALTLRPDHARSLANLGILLTKTGRAEEGADVLRQAVALQPDNPRYYRALAAALWGLRDIDGTRDAYSRALAIMPEDQDTLLALGDLETLLGRFEDAAAHYREILRRNPSSVAARLGLLVVGKTDEVGDLADFRSVLADGGKPEKDRILAGFALGKTLDTAADYDGAFSAFQAANRIARARDIRNKARPQDGGPEALVDRLIQAFPKSAFQAMAGRGDSSELPVFVVGVLRSGTSLVEQILASHPVVFGAGERTDIPAAVRTLEKTGSADNPTDWDPVVLGREATAEIARLRKLEVGAVRVVDKLPGNVFWLGHLRMMLPRAKFIVCRRDPRDIGLSCFSTYFSDGPEWTSDLGDIATQIRETDRLISHWRNVLPGPFMEVKYEDLVADLESESRRLIEFLGLEWNPVCLEFYRTERAVTTASVWQVRQKLYSQSIGRWRHYERHLGPLLSGLHHLNTDRPVSERQGVA